MSGWSSKRDMLGDEPASLAVGTEVSAKYKGAFCEAKIRKVVRAVKCKVLFKNGLGSATVIDEHVKGVIRNGAVVEAKHPEKKEYIEATITKIQDCSQYTVVFDDGDITTLRRTALCLKSGRHFAESETLDQLPLTHPEHFGTPVIGGRRRRNRTGLDGSSDDEDSLARAAELVIQKEEDIGKVVCVEGSEKRKKDNWFPGLVVAPTAQDTVEIHVKDEYLVRSFKDGRYYTVPKNEATEFTKEVGEKVIANTPKNDTQMLQAVEKAIVFLEKGELPPHWDKELLLYGSNDTGSDSDHGDSESSDDEPREKKDHFVAQLYKFMDDSGTPINKGPTIGGKDVDLYRLFKVVQNLGGYNRVTNNNNWKTISHKMSFGHNPMTISLVKQSYKKFLYSFEEFYRKLGCTMINHPRLSRNRSRSGRSLIRDIDRATPIKVEDKNKPGPSTAPLIVNIKPDPDAPPTPEPPPELPKMYPTLKDKILQKKTHIVQTPIVAAPIPPPPPPLLPMELPIPIPKIKEEKKETEDKSEVKETKKETKPRQTKAKVETEASPTKPDPPKETSKDKKNKILLRLAGGNKKENGKALKPPSVQPKPIGLANTRQKRVMKEKTKALVDQIKGKPVKQFAPTTSSAETEKVPIKVKAVKEEPGINPVGRPKKEDAAPAPSTEEKKKGRKRKEKDAIEENVDAASPNKAVSIGDKLRVFYGPTLESKVTYEAKVLNVREEGTEKLYLVHYNGWNSRYDEWINIARIAHNYSWTGARTPKKFAQMPTPSTKAAKRKVKSDSTANKDPPATGAPKDPPNTRQGSVGRSTTPSSVSSLPGRKYTNTRACTRSTNKREMSASETDHEYESDSADVEASSKQTDSDSKGPPPSAEKRRKKKKTDVASSKIKQEPKDEDTSSVIKTRRRRKSSMEKTFEKSKDADKVTVKVEEKTSDDESVGLFDSPSAKTKRNSTDNFTDEIKSFENIIPKAEPKDSEEEKPISLFPVACPKLQKEKTTYEEIPSMLKGRDFDLTQIRSELKGIVKGCDTVPVSPGASTESGIEVLKINISDEKDAEDVYEFKEPEPFEFEVRKSIEDKNKMSRRNISGRLFEEKASSKSSSSSPARSKSPIHSPSQSPKKDDSGAENQTTIQTCEEAFDKICASPLRAATEQRSHIHLPIFGASQDNSEDDFDDDSQDRLIISERDSDNFSNLSNEKDSEQNVKDNVQSDLLVLESKENFPKDDEDEDLDVDDAINVAIQRAIQESSDDTNDGEFMSKSLSKSNHPTDFSPEQGAKCEAPSAAHLESIGMSTEVEHVKTFTPQVEELSTLEVPEEKKDEIDQDDIEGHEEITTFNDDDIIMEEDAEELEVEDDEDMLVVAEEQTIEEAPELLIEERETPQISAPDTNIQTNEDEDESEENNLDSLICEETIPSSPTPQINACEEDRGSGNVESHEKKIKEVPLIREVLPPGKEIRQKTEPSPKTSDISTVSSPRKQVTSPSTSQGGFSKPGTSVTPKSGAQETLTPNNKPTSESKGKKSDGKNSGKKGRRPRKRSEETSKKRSSRSSRPHLVGSDSDDVVEMGGSSSHRERRSSPRPHKYNFTPVFGPEASFTQKISTLLQSLTNIRKTYVDVKAELAMIDRRRKKLRRRERENAAAAAAASASILASASATAKVH